MEKIRPTGHHRIPAGSAGTSNAGLRPKSSPKPAWLDASAVHLPPQSYAGA
ncbi:hypothetical protein OOU_Y34scaffold00745g110 [Pyricularia oryzae Y34]|uniref:Uncharacterized protein n=2 Tax=Pyricularia oryzae TaxID=318829 RepID=A0AA97NR39_PYRO3|nr:hypothetical protein OOU_Y34scaffold00745g110 [Pyricularia oryzae Y34]